VSQVVELIALSAGYGCLTSKYEDDRKEIFSDVYTSHILLDNKLGGQSVIVEEVQYNGRIVCVTVPTGKIVVKRNRCTMVCGNSGDPVDIICGTNWNLGTVGKSIHNAPQQKGVIELLWDAFGGTVNEKGYKVLDPHIGAIYGDSITFDRAVQICERLKAKGFASTNIVFGIGSFTYQYNTRDTGGYAVKATYGEVSKTELVKGWEGEWTEVIGTKTVIEGREIFKDPITDDGTKKSAKGLLRVDEVLEIDPLGHYKHSTYRLIDQVSKEEERKGALKTVFLDGNIEQMFTLAEIRKRLAKNL
jgi:nicotinamide phosphoribosyltransferase